MPEHAPSRVALGRIVTALAAAAYLNTLNNPFVYDDLVTVVGNASLRDWSSFAAVLLYQAFRPLVNLSYAMDRAVWEFAPMGYHATSIALHVLATALLYRVAWRAAEDRRATAPGTRPAAIALVTAALFAVHPLLSQAVGYVSARGEVLCGALTLAALLALRRALTDDGRRWFLAGVAAGVAALASKEHALVLPLVLVAWDRALLTGDAAARRARLRRVHAPLLLGAAALALGRLAAFVWIERAAIPSSLVERLTTQVVVIWRYVALLVAPVGQSLVHDAPTPSLAAGLAAWLGIAALAMMVFAVWRRAPLAAFGITWFVLFLLPGAAVALHEPMAEHRVYLASAGFCLGAGAAAGALDGWLAARGSAARAAGVAALVVAVVSLGVLTVARNRLWNDPIALWTEATARAPRVWITHYGLANALGNAGRCREAIPEFRRANERDPRPPVYVNLGACLAVEGRADEAMAAYLDALRLDPRYAPAHHNLALLALASGDPDTAHRHFLHAISMAPRDLAWRHALVGIYETRVKDPVMTLELCRTIARVARPSDTVRACIERNEARLRR